MTDDIVQRLRRAARMYPQWGEVAKPAAIAADEIERLRRVIAGRDAIRELERLRAAGDALARWVAENGPALDDDLAVLASWREVR